MVTTESLIKSIGDQPLPPVEQWDPEYCGELDLQIKADGSWFYQGTPLTRKKMILLFSRIIKKERDNYYLVTPVEKVLIKVDWMPFSIIDFDIVNNDSLPTYRFFDNCNNTIDLMNRSQMSFSEYQSQNLPIIQVRRNLFASFSRSCYYQLISEADLSRTNDQNQVTITSNGLTFSLGEYTEE